jgi:hypothetical protein
MPEPCHLTPHYPKPPPNSLQYGLAPKILHLVVLPNGPTYHESQRHDCAQATPANPPAITSHPPTQQNITPSLNMCQCPKLPPTHVNTGAEILCKHAAISTPKSCLKLNYFTCHPKSPSFLTGISIALRRTMYLCPKATTSAYTNEKHLHYSYHHSDHMCPRTTHTTQTSRKNPQTNTQSPHPVSQPKSLSCTHLPLSRR